MQMSAKPTAAPAAKNATVVVVPAKKAPAAGAKPAPTAKTLVSTKAKGADEFDKYS